MWQQQKRIGEAVPAQWLSVQGDQVNPAAIRRDLLDHKSQVIRADRWRQIPVPKAEIEAGVLAAKVPEHPKRAVIGASKGP
jgi:hypothetical protein